MSNQGQAYILMFSLPIPLSICAQPHPVLLSKTQTNKKTKKPVEASKTMWPLPFQEVHVLQQGAHILEALLSHGSLRQVIKT